MDSKGRRQLRSWIWITSVLFYCLPLMAQQSDETQGGENHRKAAEWFFQQRAHPSGSIPQYYRFEALDYLKKRVGYEWTRREFTQALTTDRWTELGPANVGGRILAIALHPSDDNIVYAGTADGGVWKTTNGGQTWTALTDLLPSLAVMSLVVDPQNPDTVYAGTGEGTFNIDAAVGKGVLKSTDGGATWTFSPAFSTYINRLAIHPTQTQILYAATRNGVFKTTDGSATWNPAFPGHNCIHLSMDPQNPEVLLTSVWDTASNQTENGIWRTTDGGGSWTRLSAGLPDGRLIDRVALARSPSNPQILYAGLARFRFGATLGIFKSIDGGSTWSQLPGAPAYCGSQCWYDNELTVHSTNPDIVFAGGLFLWKTIDGGATWTRSDVGVHVDHHAMAISRRNPNIVYNGNDGGMYRSTDTGTTWAALNYGLGATQFYALAVSATDPTITYGGTQDNGTQKGSGAPSFQLVLGGDGMVPLVDYTDPSFVYAESQNGGLARSTNGGITFLGARSGINATDRFNWVTPWVLDPVNPQVLYVGSQRLYKSINRAFSWNAISDDLSKGQGTLSTIAVAPSDPNTVYTGSSDGLVSVTTDGGSNPGSFRAITSGLPNRYVTRLRVHPADARTVYVTFSGFNSGGGVSGHVFKSTNGGESWTDVSSNLPDLPVQVIVIDPRNPSTLYLGTDLGCFRSLNDGQSWEPFNEGLPNVVVDDVAFLGNTNLLRVATHGRGIWQYITAGRTPAFFRPIVGNNQKALAEAELAFPVRIAVLDADGVPVPDVAITFEVQPSAAGGAFADGTNRAIVTTDQFGVANLPRLQLNSTPGIFSIRASAGSVPPAGINIEISAAAPRLSSISPQSAVAGQVITAGQNVLLTGSGFSSPFFVYYVQNGTWYSTLSNTFLNSSSQIYSSIPSGLMPGRALVTVGRSGEFTQPAEINITNTPTPTLIQGLFPSAPSPGQQFTASLTGQIPFNERFKLVQGASSFSATNDASFPGGAVFTMPSYAFVPGNARLEFRNHNSPDTSALDFAIPEQPAAPVLFAPSPRAPEQILSLTASQFAGFSSVPQYNVVVFTQGTNTVEIPGLLLSAGTLFAPVPGSLTAGTAEVRVRSTLSNGTVTTDPVNLSIGSAAPAIVSSVSPAIAAPGGRVTVTSTSAGAFNTNPRRNRIILSAGGTDYETASNTVGILGNTLTFIVPSGIPAGLATLRVISQFGDQSVTRLQSASLNIIGVRQITILSGDQQTANAGQAFSTPLSIKVSELDGAPVATLVTFSAPSTGTSGFFEIGGNPTTTALTMGTDGVTTSPIFKARNTGGVYSVRATIAGQPNQAVFTMRNRNLNDKRDMSLTAHGAQVSETAGAETSTGTGYLTASSPAAPLAGVSIFTLRDRNGNLISEASVPDSIPATSSFLFADARANVYTGMALVNVNDSAVTVTLQLRDAGGAVVGNPVPLQLKAREQTARFLFEFFPNLPANFVGTLTVDSTLPIAAVTLRAVTNVRNETIYSTLPLASTSAVPLIGGEVSFAHLAVGGGYRTSVILLNPTGSPMAGKLRFFNNKGAPIGIGPAGSVLNYLIPPLGHFLFESTVLSSDVTTGYTVATADAGSATPVGNLLFSYFKDTTLVAEAAVPGSRPLRRALLYIDTLPAELRDGTETRNTGLAIANRSATDVKVRLIFRNLQGEVVGIPRTLDLPAGQQTARFIDELFGSAALNTRGSLELACDTSVDILTLRGAVNLRDEFLFTTLPVADYSAAARTALVFAHFADGGGYSTQTVLLDASATPVILTIRYFSPNGSSAPTDLK